MDSITVRQIVDVATLHAVEALQQSVWGMPPQDIVPSHQLLAATQAGGAILGAFTATGRLIGFCYGFVGLRDGRLLFYSHMAGVDREYRGAQIGFRLKCAQREFALSHGITRMVWTFDPLASLNAYFNLRKLGAIGTRYYVNHYGAMQDDLNQGTESDRLEVDWWLRSPSAEAALSGARPAPVWDQAVPVLAAMLRDGALAAEEPILEADASVLRVEIPYAFATIRTGEPKEAQAWRAVTRQAFLHYFARGYAAIDFLVKPPRGAYILTRQREGGQS